ncbi:hypothetical protein BFJ72_g14753 [Fusarium proliferatum]|uniref:Amine oxidase domain-containing protein n=1 Tax=Gibberella intermedia TaxID=948311 RepID=A0A420RYQ1_GIBIN|nr:hypothetical protein FPRO03_14201 [Fusarium proliferatum]RKL22141.1 hypothetical protein BFJ72_g14753 [Fusarium proliferatum]
MAPPASDASCQEVRVAIVGTGLAGLTTAHILQNDDRKRYSVTLFEQADTLSFDSASIAVRNAQTGVVERIDLPMRASAGGYYANLMMMYEYLGIPFHPVKFLFVFTRNLTSQRSGSMPNTSRQDIYQSPEADPGTYFVHASNLHQTPPPWPGTRGVVHHIVETVFLILCQAWFTLACFFVPPRTAHCFAAKPQHPRSETLAEYTERIRLPRRYVSHYLLPLMCSVSTCSHEDMLKFPASDVVSYKKLSHHHQHYTVCGGVHQVQSKLAAGIQDVRTGARVLEVLSSTESGVIVRWQLSRGTPDVAEETFDRVVLAVTPDAVGRIFKPLRSKMEKIPTCRVDSSVLVPMAADPDIYSIAKDTETSAGVCMHHQAGIQAAQTINLRTEFTRGDTQTEALHRVPSGLVVSTCSLGPSFESMTLYTSRFTRVLRTSESRAIVKSITDRPGFSSKRDHDVNDWNRWTNGEGNVWLAGAWCWDGMVLLEGCVVSAMRVAEEFGVTIPWKK